MKISHVMQSIDYIDGNCSTVVKSTIHFSCNFKFIKNKYKVLNKDCLDTNNYC